MLEDMFPKIFTKIDCYKNKILDLSMVKLILIFIITLFSLTSVHFLLYMYGYVSIGAGDTFLHDHVLYNTINGNGLLSFGNVTNEASFHYPEYWPPNGEWYHGVYNNYFEIHKKVILVLLVPIYYVWPSVFNLFLIESIMLGLAAYPLYKICKHFLNEHTSKIIAISYLLYPTIILTGIIAFHVPTFAPLFIFLMFYFYMNKKPYLHLIPLILLLTLFENMFLVSVPIAIYYIFDRFFNKESIKARLYKYCLPVIFTTYVYYGIFIYHIIGPTFSPDKLLATNFSLTYHFGYLGSSIHEIVVNSITHPELVINIPHLSKFIIYISVMLIPVAFIPLLKKTSLITLSMSSLLIIQSVLGHNPVSIEFYNRFQVILVPFIFLALVVSVSEFQNKKHMKYFNKYYFYYALTVSILYNLWFVLSYVFGTRLWT